MSMIEQFQKLDDRIMEHTTSSVRTILRNQIALAREQVEAYQASSDKQDETLARQAKAIAELQQANANLEKQLTDLKASNQNAADDYLAEAARKHREYLKKRSLNYDC